MPELPSDHSHTGPEILSERERLYIERYTSRMRKVPRTTSSSEPVWHRILRWIEGINRRVVYLIFQLIFKNGELPKRLDPSQVCSIFVIPFGGAIGDMLVAIPLYHAIKRHLPHCKIGTFVTERNRSLLRSDPSVDEVYSMRDKRSFHNFREIIRARRSGYDVVINMHIHGMTEYGLIANAISPRGAKVSWTHARGKLYRTLYNNLIPYERDSMQEAQMGLVMLESVIALQEPILQWESRPSLIVSNATRLSVTERITTALDQLGASWYIHFNLQARHPKREWNLENTVSFAQKFVDFYPEGAIFFSASPIMRHAIEQRIKELPLPRAIFFPTSFDLHEIATLVGNAKLVITPDTAITHFASASNRPTLVLHPGLIRLPLEWVALQVPSYNLAPASKDMSTSDIPVDEVWEAAQHLLDGRRTATASSVGLHPDDDPLFQESNAAELLASLIKRSSVPRMFIDPVLTPVPAAGIHTL
jgi:ADP-heptose:LPS heptosyltransferase